MAGRKVWAADEVLAAADLQSYIQDQVVFVYANASARASGILAPTEGMVSYLQDTNLLYTYDGSAWVEVAPNVGTAGTYTKVTTDAKGRVSSGTTLSASDIPALDSSKITTGTFGSDRITGNFFTDRITGYGTGTWSGSVTGNVNNSGDNTFSGRIFNPSATWVIDSAGNISGAGTVKSDSKMQCPATYNQTNTPSRAMYVNADGTFGIGSSSRKFKENIVDANLDVAAVLQLAVRRFNYRKEFDADRTEMVGVIAEELVELGLDEFVHFDDAGEPIAVAYDRLALAALAVVQSQASRLDSLEDRLNRLESK